MHMNQEIPEKPTITRNIEILAQETAIIEIAWYSLAAGAECFPVPEKNETSVRLQSTWPTVTV